MLQLIHLIRFEKEIKNMTDDRCNGVEVRETTPDSGGPEFES